MAAIDIVFFAIMGILALRCCIKGFSREIIAIISLAAGIIAAVFLFSPVAGLLRANIAQFAALPVLPEIIAFLGILLIICIAGGLAGKAAQGGLEKMNLGELDHGLGFLLGLAEGLAIVSLILLAINAVASINVSFLAGIRKAAENLTQQSIVARALLPIIIHVKKNVLPGLSAQAGAGG
jgi:membrane protein required for colicin V production